MRITVADYLERAYWGPNADSRHGPMPDDDFSERPSPSVSDTISETVSPSPEKRAAASPDNPLEPGGSDGLAIAAAFLVGAITAGTFWLLTRNSDGFRPK